MMTSNLKIGITLIIAAGFMLCVGGYIFSYREGYLHPFTSDGGMYSFFLWLPTLIAGLIFIAVKKKR